MPVPSYWRKATTRMMEQTMGTILGARTGGGKVCRNGRKNMARGTDAGTTACGANGGKMVRRVVEGVGQAGNGAGGG